MKKLSLLAAFAAACSLSAETLSVISNADSGEGTLRDLIEVVAEGDVLEIPEGMTITLDTPVVLPGVSFDIIGLGVGATIQGDGTHTLFTAGNKKTVRKIGFRNITVTKGANQTAATAAGGAFNITGLSDANDDLSLVFNDCRFTDNRNAHTSVGAVFTHSFGGKATDLATVPFSLYCTNCVFTGNAGGSAIAGANGNFTCFARDAVFSGCQFYGNGVNALSHEEAEVAGYKYGLFNGPSFKFVFDNCVISNNVTISATGGIWRNEVTGAVSSSFEVDDTLFADNQTSGPLFYIPIGTNTFSRCRFFRNVSTNDNAIALLGSNGTSPIVSFRDTLFEDNRATGAGKFDKGGLFFARVGATSFCEFVRCAFRRNITMHEYSVFRNYSVDGYIGFTDCAFEYNECNLGGVFFTKQPSTVLRCSFIGNRQIEGSAASSSTPAFNSGDGTRYLDCTFYGNDMHAYRGLLSGGTNVISGCTIVSNIVANNYGAISAATNTVIVNAIVNGNSIDIYIPVKNKQPEEADHVAASTGSNNDKTLASFDTERNLIGKTTEELGLILPPAENNSKIKLLDGSSPLTIAISADSPLKDFGIWIDGITEAFDGRYFPRSDADPDLGAFEFVAEKSAPGLMLLFR